MVSSREVAEELLSPWERAGVRGEASANLVDHPVATARGTDLTDPDATESVPRAVATGSSMGSLSAYVLMLKLTAMHPEEAVALTLKSASPNV